jgi:hypothetical protein
MAKPLDTQSKFMGLFKVSDVYLLGGIMAFFLISFQLWAHLFGFFATVLMIIITMTLFITYIGIANSYPSGFFRYWYLFKTQDQVFIPGFEPVKTNPKREK